MTGRAAGYCAGSSVPGYANSSGPGYGRGFGFGRGWGRGFGRGFWGRGRGFWRRGYYPEPYYPIAQYIYEPSKEQEKAYLEEMVRGLEEEIKDVRNRIQELSKEKKESP
jgi:hypothetical protein